MNELIEKVPPPEIPEEWEYDESVQKTKSNLYTWKHITLEILNELWIAHEILDGRGGPKEKLHLQTFQQYCQECGPNHSTVWRWFIRIGWMPNVHFLSNSSE